MEPDRATDDGAYITVMRGRALFDLDCNRCSSYIGMRCIKVALRPLWICEIPDYITAI